MSNPHPDIRAAIDPQTGAIVASVTLGAGPERIFRALASPEIPSWWVRPGVFDTRGWDADLRVGGKWRAEGVGKAGPYALEGEFLEIEAPVRLVHSWRPAGVPGEESRLRYDLLPRENGTQLSLTHSGIAAPETREATRAGWETSLARLAEIVAAESAGA